MGYIPIMVMWYVHVRIVDSRHRGSGNAAVCLQPVDYEVDFVLVMKSP